MCALVARARLQREIVDRAPNVSVFDLREILETVERVLSKITIERSEKRVQRRGRQVREVG